MQGVLPKLRSYVATKVIATCSFLFKEMGCYVIDLGHDGLYPSIFSMRRKCQARY